MKRRFLVGLALLGFLNMLTEREAQAWTPMDGAVPTWDRPVPYWLNQQGSIDLGGFGATEVEVSRGMNDWTLVSCTALTTSYRGATAAMPGSYEGISTIGWIESGWRHSGAAIGVTAPRWSRSIQEADMALNGVNFTWTTGAGTPSDVNAYSIILHEAGHYYGLGHSDVRGSSMWPSYGGGVVGLGPDDEAGICALYPGSGIDCTTTGCPSGQECVAGACEPIVGDGMICAPCNDSSQCGGPYDHCLGYPDGSGYCGRSCTDDEDCEGGRCVGTSVGLQCVRFAGSMLSCATSTGECTRNSDCGSDQICDGGSCVMRPTTGNVLGDVCAGDADCQSGLCLAGRCTQSCDWTDATGSCPSGFYCDADASTSCDVGYCIAGGQGTGALGVSCTTDTDCASLHCDGGTCSEVCIPGGALGCPAGYACQIGVLPCRGSCRLSGAPGDPCDSNEDCTSGICATHEDRSFCTGLCGESAPCAGGFTCTSFGGGTSLCIPDLGGLGEPCLANDECLSGICATEGERSYCTRLCDETTPCPGGRSYECVASSPPGTSVCQPTGSRGGCGCRTYDARAPGRGSLPVFAGLLAAMYARRRRR